MSRERWSDEDKAKVMRLHEEALSQYPGMLAEDRYAIVSSRVAREGFRPTSAAVATMVSNLLRARVSNGNMPYPEEAESLQTLELIKDEVEDWRDYFDTKFSVLLNVINESDKAQEARHTAILKTIAHLVSFSDVHLAFTKQNSATEQEQLKVLEKINTGLDILCNEMQTLVTGLKEEVERG